MTTPTPAPTPAATPNLYQLHGAHLHITYATSGIDGKPHFTYQDVQHALHFTGDQIRTVPTEIGTLVTVTIHSTVDAGSTSFTLVVPQVNLGQSHHASIRTQGITTLHRFSIFPPANHGQRELYTVTDLSGSAGAVTF
jgi:tripartite-type tricarboxylate transporter receptor subunit TctC